MLPILAGIDKFLNMLVDWSAYLAPAVSGGLPLSPGAFMQIVGGIEIAAGLLVAIAPHIGAYVVARLWGIIVNLFLVRGYYDDPLRDFGLSLALSRWPSSPPRSRALRGPRGPMNLSRQSLIGSFRRPRCDPTELSQLAGC